MRADQFGPDSDDRPVPTDYPRPDIRWSAAELLFLLGFALLLAGLVAYSILGAAA